MRVTPFSKGTLVGAGITLLLVNAFSFLRGPPAPVPASSNSLAVRTREPRDAQEQPAVIVHAAIEAEAEVAAVRSGKRAAPDHLRATEKPKVTKRKTLAPIAPIFPSYGDGANSMKVVAVNEKTMPPHAAVPMDPVKPKQLSYLELYDAPVPHYWNTYIITLKRDELRVEHVQNLTRDDFVGSQIWWAIDGKEISDAQIDQWRKEGYLAKKLAGFMNPKTPIGKPKISCLMSHVRVWEQLAKEEDDEAFYFIMEDDVYATEGFAEHYMGVLKDLKGVAWDWVYLAIHPTFKRLNKLVLEGKEFINQAPRMVGNAGYLLSKRGAKKLLDMMFPCSLPKDQAIRILVVDRKIDAYIVKTDLVGVKGQQGMGFKGGLGRDPSRVFKSNIWDK